MESERAPENDTEHHQKHHAEHAHPSHDRALLSCFRWCPAPSQTSLIPAPLAALASVLVLPAPRELKPFGRDGPNDESPPAEPLSFPLAGRSPPVI